MSSIAQRIMEILSDARNRYGNLTAAERRIESLISSNTMKPPHPRERMPNGYYYRSKMGLSTRTLHMLIRNGFCKGNPSDEILDIPKLREAVRTGEIKRVRMLGVKTLEEIENWLLYQE